MRVGTRGEAAGKVKQQGVRGGAPPAAATPGVCAPGDGLAVADALDEAVAHDGVLVLACRAAAVGAGRPYVQVWRRRHTRRRHQGSVPHGPHKVPPRRPSPLQPASPITVSVTVREELFLALPGVFSPAGAAGAAAAGACIAAAEIATRWRLPSGFRRPQPAGDWGDRDAGEGATRWESETRV